MGTSRVSWQRHGAGGGVVFGDVRQQHDGGQLRPVGVGDDDGVVAEVAVVHLVVIGGAGVFGPELDLVEVDVGAAEEAFGGVDEAGEDAEAIEDGDVVGEVADAGELALAEVRGGLRGRRNRLRGGGRSARARPARRRVRPRGMKPGMTTKPCSLRVARSASLTRMLRAAFSRSRRCSRGAGAGCRGAWSAGSARSCGRRC